MIIVIGGLADIILVRIKQKGYILGWQFSLLKYRNFSLSHFATKQSKWQNAQSLIKITDLESQYTKIINIYIITYIFKKCLPKIMLIVTHKKVPHTGETDLSTNADRSTDTKTDKKFTCTDIYRQTDRQTDKHGDFMTELAHWRQCNEN